jgi:hypothetical protein
LNAVLGLLTVFNCFNASAFILLLLTAVVVNASGSEDDALAGFPAFVIGMVMGFFIMLPIVFTTWVRLFNPT